jgi:hypothetical protein
MSYQYIDINIEGDFIDSFIYSGTLFLVHADSMITTHNWESLVDSAIQFNKFGKSASSVIGFLKDCRKNTKLVGQESFSICIDKDELEKKCVSTIPLDGWPTDINVYSNKLYIASEKGVEELQFEVDSKKLKLDGRFCIWRKYAYKVSANDSHRLAIAAGINGVVTATPRSGYIVEREDISTLLEINSHDCEWVGRSLIANSAGGAFLSTFPELPRKPEGTVSDEYWKQYNAIKRQSPQTRRVSSGGLSMVVYAWVAGGKLFSLLNTGELSIESINRDIDPNLELDDDLDFKVRMDDRFLRSEKILAARSALFGTVIEIGDELCTVTGDGIETVSTRPVSWRVFPRAKSYLNHLHIVEKNQLSIRAYFPLPTLNQSDRFGVGTLDDVE